MRRVRCLLCVVLLLLVAAPAQAAPPAYVRTDLPDLGSGAFAFAINDSGVVAGTAFVPSLSVEHAVTWVGGELHDLGTPGTKQSQARMITDSGIVVGQVYVTDLPGVATIWRDGRRISLGTLGGHTSRALDVNDDGEVVGWSDTADRREHAFVWKDGVMTDLGTLGGRSSVAWSINDDGVIVGTADTSGRLAEREPTAPVRWDNGVATRLRVPFDRAPDDAGPRWNLRIDDGGLIVGDVTTGPNGARVGRLFRIDDGTVRFAGPARRGDYYAADVNDAGVVAVSRSTDSDRFAATWDGARLRRILRPENAHVTGGFPEDINNSGVVVGEFFDSLGHDVAFARLGPGRSVILDSAGDNSHAMAVNDSGTIAGFSTSDRSPSVAIIWTPAG